MSTVRRRQPSAPQRGDLGGVAVLTFRHTDLAACAAIGRLVSRVLRPRQGPSELARAIAEAKAAARAAGLTDADIDAELAAYNAEQRGAPAA